MEKMIKVLSYDAEQMTARVRFSWDNLKVHKMRVYNKDLFEGVTFEFFNATKTQTQKYYVCYVAVGQWWPVELV